MHDLIYFDVAEYWIFGCPNYFFLIALFVLDIYDLKKIDTKLQYQPFRQSSIQEVFAFQNLFKSYLAALFKNRLFHVCW
jgi:hypothetical protein